MQILRIIWALLCFLGQFWDVDECQRQHPCEHLCRNTQGSFRCSCQRGYLLNPDRRTCRRVYDTSSTGRQYGHEADIAKTTSPSPNEQPQQDDSGVLLGLGLTFLDDNDQTTTEQPTDSSRTTEPRTVDTRTADTVAVHNSAHPDYNENNPVNRNSRINPRFDNSNNGYRDTRDATSLRNKYYKAWYPQYRQRAGTYYNQNQGTRTYHSQNQGAGTYHSQNQGGRAYHSQNQGAGTYHSQNQEGRTYYSQNHEDTGYYSQNQRDGRYDDTATRRIGGQQIDFGLQYIDQGRGHISRPRVTVNRQPNYRRAYTQYRGNTQYGVNNQYRGNTQYRGNVQYRGNLPYRGNSQFSGYDQFRDYNFNNGANSQYRYNNQYGPQFRERTQPSIQYRSYDQSRSASQEEEPVTYPSVEVPQGEPVYDTKFINAYNMDPDSLPTGVPSKQDENDNAKEDNIEDTVSIRDGDREQLQIGDTDLHDGNTQLQSGNTNDRDRQQLQNGNTQNENYANDRADQMVKVYRKGHNLNQGKQFTFALNYIDGSEKISRGGGKTETGLNKKDDLDIKNKNKENEIEIVAPSVKHKSRVIPGDGVHQQTGINPPDRSNFDTGIYDNQGRDFHPDFSHFDVAIYPNDTRTDDDVRNSLKLPKQERNNIPEGQELASLNQIPRGDRIYRGPVFSQTPPNGPFEQPIIRGPVFSQTAPKFPPGQGGVQQPMFRSVRLFRPIFDPYSGQGRFSRWIQRSPWQVQDPCSAGCGYNGCLSGCGGQSQFSRRFIGALYPCGGGSLGPCSENQWQNSYSGFPDPDPCADGGCVNDQQPCAVPGGCQDMQMQDSDCPNGGCLNHEATPCAVPGGCDNLDSFIGPQPCQGGECMNHDPTPCAVPGGCDGLDMMDTTEPCMGGDCMPPCDSGDCMNHDPAPCAVPGGCEHLGFSQTHNCPFGPCQSGAICTLEGCMAMGPMPCDDADCLDHSKPCDDPTCHHNNNQHTNQLPWKPRHLGNNNGDDSNENNAESSTNIPNTIPKDTNKGGKTKHVGESKSPSETQQHEGRKIRCPEGAQLVHTEQGPQCTYLKKEECIPACQNRGTCDHGKCVCPKGLRGIACQDDVDECRENIHTCEHKCENTFGGHICTCPPGMNATETGACKELECEPKCRNGGTCSLGKCQCPPGFKGKDCSTDINECDSAMGKGLCEHICMNSYGSFTCHCPPGQTLNDDQRTCKNQTACSTECQNGGTCIDTRCQCPWGFYGRNCELDIDECHHFKPCSHTCVNSLGSYECQCPEGYTLQYNKRRCEPLEDKNNRDNRERDYRRRERQNEERSRS